VRKTLKKQCSDFIEVKSDTSLMLASYTAGLLTGPSLLSDASYPRVNSIYTVTQTATNKPDVSAMDKHEKAQCDHVP